MTMSASEDLNLLERDIEATRERLARDLDRLRSSETIASFKEVLFAQATEAKDHLVGKAQEKLSAGIEDMWGEMKARAAANPAATVAIGAGIAWRIVQRPPIASVLVGIGLISLLRTDPRKPVLGADLVERSMDQLVAVKQKTTEWATQEGGLRDTADTAGAMAHHVIQSTVEAAKHVAGKSASTVEDLGEQAQQALPLVREGARTVVDHVSTLSTPSEERDRYLLGAAALALAAAVGIAAQRRS
jgi:hypothetical protein